VLASALLLAACSRPAPEPAAPAAAPLPIVATFTLLADMVANIGGDRVAVRSLVGPDGDAHVFSPSPADAKTLAGAGLVVVNGMGFEGWIDRLIAASGYRGPVVVASEGIAALPLESDAHGHAHSHGHAHAAGAASSAPALDPHGWQSPAQARRYVANILSALVAADPSNAEYFRERARTYDAKIEALDRAARERLGRIPEERRRVITGHDAFGHLGAAYGIRFFSPRGVSTGGEASARDVGRLIRQIREQRIRAVFVENISDPRLVEQIARESGARVGGVLFSDALSAKDARASTYLEMMRHNIETIASALAEEPAAR
jgi:zinc/manganese transport system substrate-binding protein